MNRKQTIRAVENISLEIYPGEIYGLVGESGSGKSTLARTMIRLYQPSTGEIFFHDKNISGILTKSDESLLRSKMQMIFQNPLSSLNPRKKVIDLVAQGPDLQHSFQSRAEREEAVFQTLSQVGLSPKDADRYPHQFSGGQCQRIGIARALIMKPDLIIADEPIAALDASIQAQIINLMKEIQASTKTSFLFIAHDLSMVKYSSKHIGVMHKGYLVEWGTSEEIFDHPLHPYTKSLLSCVPLPNPLLEKRRVSSPYHYESSGLDYAKGKPQLVQGEHFVWASEEEFCRFV